MDPQLFTTLIAVALVLVYFIAIVSALEAILNARTSQGAVAWAISLLTLPYITVPLLRRTTLFLIVVSSTYTFQMVEHLMAALAALEIDNCIVEVDADNRRTSAQSFNAQPNHRSACH